MRLDPIRDYALAPHGRVRCRAGELTLSLRVNALGMNDIERHAAPRPGTFRVVMLGDSFTEGYGVPARTSMPSVVEKELARRGRQPLVEVLNAGVNSYSPVLEYIQLQSLLDLQPHLVLVAVDISDAQGDHVYEEFVLRRDRWGLAAAVDGFNRVASTHLEQLGIDQERAAKLNQSGLAEDGQAERALAPPAAPEVDKGLKLIPGPIRRLLTTHSALYRAVRSVYHDLLPRPLPAVAPAGLGQRSRLTFNLARGLFDFGNFWEDRVAAVLPLPYYQGDEVVWGLSQRYILGMRRLLAARDIPLVLVVYPWGRTGEEREGAGPWDNAQYLAAWVQFGQEQGLPVINLAPAFERSAEPQLFFRTDPHFTTSGHAVAGKAIAEFLVTSGLVP